jgi:hypothetical protein
MAFPELALGSGCESDRGIVLARRDRMYLSGRSC